MKSHNLQSLTTLVKRLTIFIDILIPRCCRCSKFSSFNHPMDDTPEGQNWNIFAPIAKLESLDEIDQVDCLL